MIWLTSWEIRKLVSNRGKVTFSPDLGISTATAEVTDEYVIFPDGSKVPRSKLMKLARDETHVHIIRDNNIFKATLFADNTNYKLTPVMGGAPTHEINGIRMHRMKDITPEQAVKKIIDAMRIRKREKVLDICTGMGYTSIMAARNGAYVTTIEIDPNVLELTRYNPWSQDLWEYNEEGQIKIIKGDAFEEIKKLPDEYFDKIIHDPPRMGTAGELYSFEFYTQMYRVAKPGAKLFHYTGNPGEKYRRKSVTKGVMERLRKAGWQDVKRVTDIQGILAYKPIRRKHPIEQ